MDKGINGVTALGFGLKDYIQMFDLTDDELNMNILDCRAGASCFAAQMHAESKHVTASDPLYQLPIDQIKKLVLAAKDSVAESFAADSQQFAILPDHANEFMQTIEQGLPLFFTDFEQGKQDGRYVTDSLPNLSFKNEKFDLALVCHYLFTFSDQISSEEHYKAIKELVRVANEVRIFPLVTYSGHLSPYVGEVVAMLQANAFDVELRGVNYELQNQGNAMLRVWANECSVAAHEQQDAE